MATIIDGTTITFNDTTVQQSASNTYALGTGQTWSNPTRTAGTSYTNTTGRPILFVVSGSLSGSTASCAVTVSGTTVCSPYWTGANIQYAVTSFAIIPSGATYSWSGNLGNVTVAELR